MTHVKRNTATDKSFADQNSKFLHHPKSSVPSKVFKKADNESFLKRLDEFRQTIKQEILSEMSKSSHKLSQPYSSQATNQIAFLTKDELDKANENAQRRIAQILSSDPIPSLIRPDISKTEINDPGLAWLYESPITFVDTSEDVSDQVRLYDTVLLCLHLL